MCIRMCVVWENLEKGGFKGREPICCMLNFIIKLSLACFSVMLNEIEMVRWENMIIFF